MSNVTETVTVSGTPVVETTRAAVASTLNQRTIENTPILGRKFEDLLTLTPGVSVVQGADGDEITFAGQRGVFNNISLDGGDFNNGFFGEQVGGQRAPIDITLDAVKEFQVIASGAPAEFGRTAGGVVNVITKSGTQRTARQRSSTSSGSKALTGELSDGSKLEDFHREQFGGTFGGPLQRDRAFFFGAVEGITGNFQRPNLGSAIGTPCPVAAPTLAPNEALIDELTPIVSGWRSSTSSRARLGQDEAQPIEHPIKTVAFLLKTDCEREHGQPPGGLLQLQPLAQGERDLRRRDLRHRRPTAPKATRRGSTSSTPTSSRPSASNKLNEFHFTYSRESAAAHARTPSNLPRRHRHGLRAQRSASATRSSCSRASTS